MLSTVSEGVTIMSIENIVQALDKEIANLTQARALLNGSGNRSNGLQAVASSGRKRVVSLSARRKMAAAQKARWAKFRAKKKAA
jgi:surface antigen